MNNDNGLTIQMKIPVLFFPKSVLVLIKEGLNPDRSGWDEYNLLLWGILCRVNNRFFLEVSDSRVIDHKMKTQTGKTATLKEAVCK
jgi:hypothetical protein